MLPKGYGNAFYMLCLCLSAWIEGGFCVVLVRLVGNLRRSYFKGGGGGDLVILVVRWGREEGEVKENVAINGPG